MARKTSKRKVTAVGIAEERLHLLGRTTWEIDRTNFKLHETAAEPRGSTAPAGGSPQSLKAAEAERIIARISTELRKTMVEKRAGQAA